MKLLTYEMIFSYTEKNYAYIDISDARDVLKLGQDKSYLAFKFDPIELPEPFTQSNAP